MKILPFISLFFIALLATSATAASVTPEKAQVTELLNNYGLQGQNNSYQLACEIGQYVSEEYGWNCDIRQLNFTKHAPVYVNVFYPAANNKKGYDAYYGWFGPQRKEVTGFVGEDHRMYYRDWYNQGNECYISGLGSYGIVKSYYGNVESTDPVVIVEPNESAQHVAIVIPNESHEDERIVLLSSNNNTVQTVDLENNSINNSVTNSTGTVNNQGVIDTLKQYIFDFSNTDWSNVSFNFWGN